MRKPRRAVVLLMTLALIALASLAMTRLANQSMETVRQGVSAQHDLQRRWTEKSCRITLLQRSEELFAASDQLVKQQGEGWPLPRILSLELTLGGQSTTVVMRDEDASVNINQLHVQAPQQLPTIIAQSALATRAPIRLRPWRSPRPDRFAAFSSWGQVVDLSRIGHRGSIRETLAPISDTLTCWGQGRLNLSRASDDAVRLVVEPILDPAKTAELIQARRGFDGELETLWGTLELHRTKQLQLNRVLGTRSQSFSMWLVHPTAGRPQSTLMVSQSGTRGARSTSTWRW